MNGEASFDFQNRKYFLYIAILFVAVLMVSNTVAVKIIKIGPLFFSGAIFIFPISYIFGDILTEVYGYRASRKIIWSGFAALIFMALVYWLVQILPVAPAWPHQSAYEVILGAVPRVVLGSIIAYFIGEFANSYVLSRMKLRSKGKHLWKRTIGSTLVGEAIDSTVFGIIAFAGIIPFATLSLAILSGYVAKVLYEVIATPLTYKIVKWLKREEGIDTFDTNIAYNPFSLK